MIVLLHGEAGGWDELLIALVAFAVLWIAVKLAGRKPAADDQEDEGNGEQAAAPESGTDPRLEPTGDRTDPVSPPATTKPS